MRDGDIAMKDMTSIGAAKTQLGFKTS